MSKWTITGVPYQAGRLAVVTGAGGLGYETALALAGAGAAVIIAGRREGKGRDAIERILEISPRAQIRFEKVDLADLSSVAGSLPPTVPSTS